MIGLDPNRRSFSDNHLVDTPTLCDMKDENTVSESFDLEHTVPSDLK